MQMDYEGKEVSDVIVVELRQEEAIIVNAVTLTFSSNGILLDHR